MYLNRKYFNIRVKKNGYVLFYQIIVLLIYTNFVYAQQGKIEVFYHTPIIEQYQEWLNSTGFSGLYQICPAEQLSIITPMDFSLIRPYEQILCLINPYSVKSEQEFEKNFFEEKGIQVADKLLYKFAYLSNVLPKRVSLILHSSPCTRIYKANDGGKVGMVWGKCDEFHSQKSAIPVAIERNIQENSVGSLQFHERLPIKLTASKISNFFEGYFEEKLDAEFDLVSPLENDRVFFSITNLRGEIIRGENFWETIMVMIDFRQYGREWIISITTQGGYSAGFTPPSITEFEDIETSIYHAELDRYTSLLIENLKAHFMKGE